MRWVMWGGVSLAGSLLAGGAVFGPPAESMVVESFLPSRPTTDDLDARPLFDANPAHPFNRVHAALFDHAAIRRRAWCLEKPGRCATLRPRTALELGSQIRVAAGGDRPAVFMSGEVAFLLEPLRERAVLSAIAAAIDAAGESSDVARVLLQSDLWERYDAIEAARGGARGSKRERLAKIQGALVGLIDALALPPARLTAIPSNHAEVHRAYPELVPHDPVDDGWLELWPDDHGRPGAQATGTQHAARAGHRMVFRVFARSTELVGLPSTTLLGEVPPGTRLALVATPLAIASTVELIEVPLVVLVQARVASDMNAPVNRVPVDFLEGRRSALTREERVAGGLVRWPADAPIPAGVTSSGCSVDLVPVAASCVRCHQTRAGGSGNALAREMSRNGRPDTAARIVVERKWNDEGFARLAEALVEHRTTPVVVGPTARHER